MQKSAKTYHPSPHGARATTAEAIYEALQSGEITHNQANDLFAATWPPCEDCGGLSKAHTRRGYLCAACYREVR